MKCPNCNNNIESGNACGSCGIDIVLFKNTIKISDLLYNKGLALAQANDLYSAKDALNKSIQFNKNNYYARNLLGLVYYETGCVADALKHWIISSSLVSENNPATRYIVDLQNLGKRLDLFSDAIKMYNQALTHIRQKSDDLAIIQLKKAIEINPKFIDAMNLLSFCYLIQNQKSYASELVNKVLAIDVNNPIALNYYKVIYQTKKRPKPMVSIVENKKPVYAGQGANRLTKEEHKKSFGNNFYFTEIISFVLGGLCMLLIAYTIMFPRLSKEDTEHIAYLEHEISRLNNRINTELMESENIIAARDLEISEMKELIDRLFLEVDTQEKLNRLNLAKEFFDKGEVIEAAAMIYAINPIAFSEEDLERYENLKTLIYASAANLLYNDGLKLIASDDLESAKRSFETVLLYAPEGASYLPDTTYQLGLIAENEEDFERAAILYNAVIENFPSSNRATNARTRLNNISD